MKKEEKDGDMIRYMHSEKKLTTSDRRDPQRYNAIVNRIIENLRKNNHSATLSDLQRVITDFDIKGNKEFINFVKSKCENLRYDDNNDSLLIVSKYQIKNIEDLKEKIKASEYGLPENLELEDCYPKIKEDIAKLKKENRIKVIHNEEKKLNVLFYKDKDDPIEKILSDETKSEALKFIRTTWNSIKAHENFEDREKYLGKKQIRAESKKERKRKLKNRKFLNTHLNNEELFGYKVLNK
jgi:hypothetical protein